MRKGRLTFWAISLIICCVAISIYNKQQNMVPYEQRQVLNVYCREEFKNDLKKMIDESKLGETHQVVFTRNVKDAELILTDEKKASDADYEKIAWTPLIVVFDNSKEKTREYETEEYLKLNSSYTLYFGKVIDSVISGTWTDKIYCPKEDTTEGRLFHEFLLITVNDGIYPSEDQMAACENKVNQFLSSKMVVRANATERLKTKMVVENEMYFVFENEIYNMTSSSYDFDIAYPENTVVKEWYVCYRGSNKDAIREVMEYKGWIDNYPRIFDLMMYKYYRIPEHTQSYNMDEYRESDGYSYVEIPVKE